MGTEKSAARILLVDIWTNIFGHVNIFTFQNHMLLIDIDIYIDKEQHDTGIVNK